MQHFLRPFVRLAVHVSVCLAAFIGALTATAAYSAEPRTGVQIYEQFCANCHSGGWQGAPVSNDSAEWAERVAKGWDSLFNNAKNGLNGMPPKGTCMDCSDEELSASIKEMLNF